MKTKVSVEEMKRHLKRTLKNKVRITISLVFAFLLTNSISMADYLNIDNGKIYSGSSGNSNNKNKEQEGESVALNIRESGDQNEVARDKVAKGSIAIGKGAVTKENNKRGEYGVAIGYKAKSSAIEGTALGNKANAASDQATAIGTLTYANKQSTAIGSNVYAYGESSIAIGNDDITSKYSDFLPDKTIKEIFKDIKDKSDIVGDFKHDYIDQKMYSPTYAAGKGSIAIGSRAIALGDGSTSMGTLSFALAEGSTALGLRSFVGRSATGGLAVGEEARVFSANSLAIGNKNEATSSGAMSYGYLAKAVGEGSLAIGHTVGANADISNLSRLQEIYGNRNTDLNTKMSSLIGYTPEYSTDGDTVFSITKNENGSVKRVEIKKTKSLGKYGIALGNRTFALGENSMTLGSLSLSEGKNSMALGVASYAKDENALTIGANSVATSKNAMALGVGAEANLENSMAIGVSSITDYKKEWLKQAGYAPEGAISMPTSANIGVVSFGSIGQERRLTNVASGYRDTDAVNVAQLRSLEEKLSTVNPDEKESSMVNYISVDKNVVGSEGQKVKEIAMKQLYYKLYVQLKAKKLEIEVRKAKNKEEFDDEFIGKLDKKISELEGKNIEAINSSKIKNFDVNAKLNDNRLFTKDILKEINDDKDIDLSEDKVNAVLSSDEKILIENSNFYNSKATGKDSIAMGVYAKSSGAEAIAIGSNAEASGANSIVIGSKNTKNDKTDNSNPDKNISTMQGGKEAVAIGHGVDAKNYAVGIGANVYAEDTAIAIGDRAKSAGKYAVSIGEKANTNSESAVAIGNNAQVTAKQGIALGLNSKVSSENGIAIGQGSKSEHNDSIAIGNGAVAKSSINVSYFTNKTHAGGEVVSFGNKTKNRRLTNLADGSNDSDAVTVGQLKSVETDIRSKILSPEKVLSNLEGENGIYVKKDTKANSTKWLIGIDNNKLGSMVNNKFEEIKTYVDNKETNINNKIDGKYINFSGDNLNDKVKVNLDGELQIKGDTSNIAVTKDTNGLKVALKDNISVNSIKVNNKKINVEGDNLTFDNKTIVTGDKIDTLTLKYAANGNGNNEVLLSNGLNFTDGKNISSEVLANGVVKYNLNSSLTDIDSIKGGKDKNASEIKFNTDNGVQIINGTHTVAINNGKITGLDGNDITIENNKAVSGAMLNNALKEYAKTSEAVKDSDLSNLGFYISDNNNTSGQKITVKGNGNKINFVSSILDIDTKESGKVKFSFNQKGKEELTKELLTKVPDIVAKENSPITVETKEKNGKTSKIIGIDEEKIKAIVNSTEITNYTKNDLSNITNEGKTAITNLINAEGTDNEITVTTTIDETSKVKKFKVGLDESIKTKINSIGTGSISKDNTNTVNGGVVYTAIENAKTKLLSKKITFKGDDQKTVTKGLDETLNIKGGATSGSENNIYVEKGADDTLNIKLAKSLSGLSSITMDSGITINSNGINMNNKKITNLATPETGTDAVNKTYVDSTVEEKIQAIADDLRNGKGIKIEANSPMVYVFKTSDNKIEKVKKIDDKVYKESDIDEATKKPKENAKELTSEQLKKVYIATLNPDKTVSTKTIISNVSEGEIKENSTDAINGSQIAKILGIDGTNKKIDENGNLVIKGKDGQDGKISIIEKLVSLDETTNKAITFKANNTDKNKEIKLGDSITIKTENTESYDSSKYSGKNLYAKVVDDGINIEMKESPEFSGVTVGDEGITIKKGNSKTVIVNVDNSTGDLIIKKDGKESTVITNNNIGNQVINYANNGGTSENVALNKGFNFANGTNTTATVTKENDIAKVQFNLNDTLSGITSIEGKTPNNSTKLSFVDSGLSLNNKKIIGLADGDISDNSTDAITGGQIKKITDKLGIELKGKQDINVNITKIKNEKGEDVTNNNSTIVQNIDEVIKTINKGLKFDADQGGVQTNQLGSMVSIKKANSEIKEADVSYLGKNILTKISKDTEGNSLVELAFKDKPEFSELTLGGTSLKIDNGNLTIGGNTVVTTNNIGSQEISYKVNDEPTSSKVSLNTGFTFKGDMDNNIKVSKDNDGVINFNLSSTLSGITSISNGDKKIEITNEGVKIGDVTINGNTINIKNVDATKTPQNGDVITYEYFNKTINNLNVGKATQDELDKKANKDASNLDDGDITKWKEKLGVTNLDLKVQGTNGSYTTTLANGVVFENGDIDVKATASSDTSKKEGKLKLTLKEEYKKKLNAIDIEDNKKLSDVYLKVDASNLSDTGVNNLITKLGTGNGTLTDSNKNKLVTGNTLDATLQSKFIKFMGDENTTYDGNEQGTKVNLDGTLNIKGGVVRKEKDKDDETKEKELQNILVKTDKDKISLDLSKDLYGMNSIEFVNKHGNKSTININDNGDLVINNNKGNTSTIITSNTILEQDINYRVNGVTRIRKPNEKLTLKDGLNFIKDDNDNIKITDDGNLGDIKFNLNKNLKGIKTVGIDDKTNITFDNTVSNEKVDIKVAGKTLSITKDADGIKVSGITDKNVEDTNYGASGEAATRKEVKQVYDKIQTFTVSNQELKDGLAGNTVYTDKDGKELVKTKDGDKFKYTLKDGGQEVDPSDVVISLKDANGKTAGQGITLSNVKSTLKDENVTSFVNGENSEIKNSNAATLGDLQKIASNGVVKFTGNNANVITENKFGEIVAIKGEGVDSTSEFNSASGNIKVDVADDKKGLDIKLSKNLKNLESAEFNGKGDKKIIINNEGIKVGDVNISINGDITGAKIDSPLEYVDSNGNVVDKTKATSVRVKDNLPLQVKDGLIAKGSKEVVNGGQIYEIKEMATQANENANLALGGVSNAVAMANLVQVSSSSNYRHNLSAAYGYYGGSHALAIGFSGTNENRNFVYKLSGAVNNRGNLALGIGAGIMVGNVDNNNFSKDRVKELETIVKKQDEKLKDQDKKMKLLEQKLEELSKKIR